MFEKGFKKQIYVKSFILSLIVLGVLNSSIFYFKFSKVQEIQTLEQTQIILDNVKEEIIQNEVEKEVEEKIEEKIVVENIEEINTDAIYYWHLEIPKFEVSANIDEGTSSQTLDEYIGHFEDTPIEFGNICLASHNRGYSASYFGKIKDLNIDDEIIYYLNNKKYIYKVFSKETILETDWTKLENTKENILTLVTCVEDVPNYRRIVQAKRE